jgi:DnaA family protein
MQQIPLAIGPEALPTFDSFLAGPNAGAHDHLRTLVLPAAPVYLWGPPAAARRTCCARWRTSSSRPGQRVGWFDATDAVPWPLAADWSLVVIDGCESLDAAAQHAAFHAVRRSHGAGRADRRCGRLPPVDLPLRDDLRTRLGWGHVFALQPLSEAETRAACAARPTDVASSCPTR